MGVITTTQKAAYDAGVTKLAGISTGADVTLTALAAASTDIAINSKKITGHANGVLDTDGVNFGQVNDLSGKKTCTASTTAALAGTWTYANGTAGVGATLTRTTNGALEAQDGITLGAGLTLFVRHQAAGETCGRYDVTQFGDASTPVILTRSTDADTAQKLRGSVIAVAKGTIYSGTVWILPLKSSEIAVGTTALAWTNSAIQGLASAQADISINGKGIINARMATIAPGDVLTSADAQALYVFDWKEDWNNGDITGTQKWVNVVAGTGTVTSSTNGISDMHPGVLVLSRGTTAVSRAGTFQGTTAAAWVLGANGTLYQHWCFRIATLSDGTNTFLCYLGHGDTSASGAQVNGVTIVVDTATDSHVGLQARSSSTGAVSFGTFVVPANTWVNARMKKAHGGTVFGLEVLIAGVWTDQGISISTNIPTTQVDVLAKLDGTVGTANRTLELDFVHQRVVYPNGRT